MRVHTQTSTGQDNRRGVSATEFVVILPVLVAILAGTSDYARFSSTSMAISTAARSAAGYSCLTHFDEYTRARFMQECRQRVEAELSTLPGFNSEQVQMEVSYIGSPPEDRIEVVVTYPFETVVNWGIFNRTTQVTRRCSLPMIR
ncbi:MAG: TadE family protein [Planctomycetaceae bacterium]